MKKLNYQIGITLIALVVTIIILLILAGVTLNLALGEGGIFARAKNTVEKYQAAQANEVDQLAQFEEMLNTYGNGGTNTGGGEETTNTVEPSTTPSTGSSAGEIAGLLEKGDNSALGKKVDISGIITTGKATEYSWQILYADESNIYLIATNYVKIADCPTTAGGKSLNKGSTDYYANFTDIVGWSDYASIEAIKSNADVAKLNSQFFAVESLPDATNANMKAVGYMLDTNIWAKQFVGEANSKVDYVVGNPSIELLLKAYNKYNGTEYSSQADKAGYKVSTDGSSYSTAINYMLRNTDQTYNTALVLNNTDVDGNAKNADYMWVASPSAGSTSAGYVMRVNHVGGVDRYTYDGSTGFRPVLCLNKDVVLEKQTDGNYKAK